MKATMIAEGYDLEHKEKTKELNEVHIPVNEVSLLYEAIPFLPIVPAVFCCVLNFILPGSGNPAVFYHYALLKPSFCLSLGSLLCGFFLLCVGQPRIQMKEGRVFMSILVNVFVGVAQFGCTLKPSSRVKNLIYHWFLSVFRTITFLLVGYFWSVAWGLLLLTHSRESKNIVAGESIADHDFS